MILNQTLQIRQVDLDDTMLFNNLPRSTDTREALHIEIASEKQRKRANIIVVVGNFCDLQPGFL